MSLIIPEGFAQVTMPLLHVGQSREAVITFGTTWEDTYDGPETCDAIMQAWIDNIGPLVDEGCVQGPVRAAIGGPGGENLQVEGALTFGSGGTNQVVPSNVALLVRKITLRGGRRGRGRFYVPWIVPESLVSDTGGLDGSWREDVNGAFEQFRIDIAVSPPTGPGTVMYLLHSSGGSTTPGSPNAVQQLVVDPLVATQRRRLRP